MTTLKDERSATWHKSSRSSGGANNCVELGAQDHTWHAIRDSKDPHGPALSLSHDTVVSLIGAVKAGRLPHAE
ncbi:DUF397 domain-containing protein [Saccharopolyspora sp. NPDC047091]|uniref:DUF397 domain-containing protein n=1 Tax=Saccharopolyspora sp. NPDC047091 TaxID=3155924 RepID=UPI0033F3E094